MQKGFYIVGLCLLLLISVTGCLSDSEPEVVSDASPKEMVAFVQTAFEYADMHGKEAALLAFNDPGGPFVKGDLYIFAYEKDGTTLALPFEPDQIGTSRSDLQDAEGRYFIREIIETGLAGGGFVSYLYANPTHGFAVEPKISYVMKGGDGWVLGSGLYSADDTMMPDPEVTASLADFVDDAALYAERVGKEEALATFNDLKGPYVRGDLYIYALDVDGIALALPYQPELLGTSMLDLTDHHGLNVTRIEIALSRLGGGFIYYHYPNPGRGMQLEPKVSYVRMVDDTYWIGAGIYYMGEGTFSDEIVMQALLSRYHEETEAKLNYLDNEVLLAGAHASAVGLDAPSTHEVLAYVAGTSEAVYDVVSLDSEGRIIDVYPEAYASAIGADISAQPHIRVILDEKKPVLSHLLHTVEGQDGVSIAYPVVTADGRIAGGISAIILPSVLLGGAAEKAEIGSPHSARAIQVDGTVLYAEDPKEIGAMIFPDPGYEIFPDVGHFRSRILTEPKGAAIIGLSGVKKHVVWDTVSLHGTDWRLLVFKEF
ncbi:cache domain-containing protein [Methanocalculus sp.]|uniref:cache domain-containing protein n=1 Tax=Methanocalculus sp. TaxID=2004547 RepID=UPI002618DAC6|nr:cache domain-containing protein [Methanocalculus sp.]MDG6249843.1 cache domain-containing protein [Methanocalculus sp.]